MRRRLLSAVLAVIALALTTLLGCAQMPSQEQDSSATRQAPAAPAQPLRVTTIDVGKGDCILIESGSYAALIDTGYDATSGKVVSYLKSRGIDKLLCVILTHYDRDHIGGLGAIAKAMPIGEVLLPNYDGGDKNYEDVTEAVRSLKLPAHKTTQETSFAVGDAQLTVFPTSLTYVIEKGEDEGNDNDLSLVTTLTHGSDTYLFAGDLEKEGIMAYLDANHGTFDVLKMPHHGHKCGKNDELIEDVQPKVAIITDSADEPADKKTLGLLEDAGIDTYCTAKNGNIVVESDGTGNYTVTTER